MPQTVRSGGGDDDEVPATGAGDTLLPECAGRSGKSEFDRSNTGFGGFSVVVLLAAAGAGDDFFPGCFFAASRDGEDLPVTAFLLGEDDKGRCCLLLSGDCSARRCGDLDEPDDFEGTAPLNDLGGGVLGRDEEGDEDSRRCTAGGDAFRAGDCDRDDEEAAAVLAAEGTEESKATFGFNKAWL